MKISLEKLLLADLLICYSGKVTEMEKEIFINTIFKQVQEWLGGCKTMESHVH